VEPQHGDVPAQGPERAALSDEEAARLTAIVETANDPRLTAVMLTKVRLHATKQARLAAEAARVAARDRLTEVDRSVRAAEAALRDAVEAAVQARGALDAAEEECQRHRTDELRVLQHFKEMVGSPAALQAVVDEAARLARLIGAELHVPPPEASPADPALSNQRSRTYTTKLTDNRRKLLACFPRDRAVDLEELTRAYYGGEDSEQLRDNIRTVLKWLIKLGYVERATTRGQYLRCARQKESTP